MKGELLNRQLTFIIIKSVIFGVWKNSHHLLKCKYILLKLGGVNHVYEICL